MPTQSPFSGDAAEFEKLSNCLSADDIRSVNEGGRMHLDAIHRPRILCCSGVHHDTSKII